MSSSSALDVLHISTRFDDSVHEYQFARSHPQLFAQLQQLTAAKYPLSPLYIHYTDEDGDMVRVTNETELREAVRVCGSRLNLVLSSGLPSSSSSSSSSSAAPQQHSIASATLVSQPPSPSPSLTSTSSPLPTSSVAASLHSESIEDIDSYLSSDEEDLFEQARSQVHDGQHRRQSMSGVAAPSAAQASLSPRNLHGVVALDSDGEEEEGVEQVAAVSAATAPTPVVADQPVETQKAAEVEHASVPECAADSHNVTQSAEQQPISQAHEAGAVSPSQLSVSQAEASEEKCLSLPIVSHSQVDSKDDMEDTVEAITDRLRSFYQLDQHRQAIVSSATASAQPSPSPSPVAIAQLFSSFFAEPSVVATIRDNAALLTPLMASSSFPLFLHQLCLLNPALSSHPLVRYSFSIASLHPFTVCVHCNASPVVGRLLYCRICDTTLCGACQQHNAPQHPADHPLTELPTIEYRPPQRDTSQPQPQPSLHHSDNSSGGSGVERVVLEERKASDFVELSDRMRASGQRVWKQGGAGLRKVDDVLTQFAADIKRMIESMLDNVFSDAATKQSSDSQQQHSSLHQSSVEEHKQQAVLSPRSRQQQPAVSGCSVRRPPCLPGDKSYASAVASDRREPAVAQPVRQSMSSEAVRATRPPHQQQSPVSFAYRAQLDTMADMGLIQSAVDEETCKELLNASKGNVDQAVQWLMDKINV